jgi:hypothetical protein
MLPVWRGGIGRQKMNGQLSKYFQNVESDGTQKNMQGHFYVRGTG